MVYIPLKSKITFNKPSFIHQIPSNPTKSHTIIVKSLPIGSMYGTYANIYHQYTPNVSIYIYIYTIHGSYGLYESPLKLLNYTTVFRFLRPQNKIRTSQRCQGGRRHRRSPAPRSCPPGDRPPRSSMEKPW